ncbi:hypothetical protein DID88_010290 [Monilinia fructigena]|uniref:Peptidase S8/S53 domain-containing protein n=1 Tax=Monilinia fructigena TaxID=38457 RepID=A0A395IM30_9HELO|nr:hypothetical protein DID88_010290 [Monilinia fructigena]
MNGTLGIEGEKSNERFKKDDQTKVPSDKSNKSNKSKKGENGRNGYNREKVHLGKILSDVLEEFPETCVSGGWGEQDSINQGQKLEDFRKLLKTKLKDAKNEPRDRNLLRGKDNLFHVMVKEYWQKKNILMGDENNREDRPLHDAVKQFPVLVRDERVGDDDGGQTMGPDEETEEEDYKQDHNYQQNYADVYDLQNYDKEHDENHREETLYAESNRDSEYDEEGQFQSLLDQMLKELGEESVRPRPHPRIQAANHNTENHLGTGEVKNGQLKDERILALAASVRLLVKACPDALTTKNESEKTPYQEREHTLPNDSTVEEFTKAYAEKKDSDGGTQEAREAQRHIEFDLAGLPTTVIKAEYLKQLEIHLKFERVLKYVALPVLSVESQPAKRDGSMPQTELHRNGRSDLVAIFEWLWQRGVREIIKVMVIVIDNGNPPHASGAIVDALYGFEIEEWNWKKIDLCSDVISESSLAVREVSLYSSGKNAVLMGWASEGLGNREKFPHLEKINLYVQEGLGDNEGWKWNNRSFVDIIIKHGRKGPNGKDIEFAVIADNNIVNFSSELSTTKKIEEAHLRIKSVRDFSTFLMNSSMKFDRGKKVPPVKVAIIDDGIDATMYDFQSKIAGGVTFCPWPHSADLVNSYFVPREISTLTGNGRRITPSSAAKAVE